MRSPFHSGKDSHNFPSSIHFCRKSALLRLGLLDFKQIIFRVGLGGSPTLTDNQTLAETEVAYAAMFDGSVDWDVETLAELMATFSRKTGGPADLAGGPPDAGAIGSAAVTWATTVPGSDGANLVS